MILRRFRLVLLATLVAGGLGVPAAAAPDPVRLVAPAPGARLAAGSTVELAWEPGPGFASLPKAEEWEAFLSLDGGRSYPLRVTPHLDLDVRRVRIDLPDLPAADVRLVLRFGDERRETEVPLDARFAIVAGGADAAPGDTEIPAIPSTALLAAASSFPQPLGPQGLGEAVRPGARGVVAWVEGSRRGTGLRRVVANGWGGLEPRTEGAQGTVGDDLAAVETRPPQPLLAPAPRPGATLVAALTVAVARRDLRPGRSTDLLLLGRRNE